MGGDHLISYPILKAIDAKHGPVALIHIDAHSDTAEHQVSDVTQMVYMCNITTRFETNAI